MKGIVRQTARGLVDKVLDSLPRPLGNDVIDDVFCAIEANERWRGQFDVLADGYTRGYKDANRVIAWSVARAVGISKDCHIRRCASRSRLVDSYTQVDINRARGQ